MDLPSHRWAWGKYQKSINPYFSREHLDAFMSSDRRSRFGFLYLIMLRFVLQRPYKVDKVICQLLLDVLHAIADKLPY